MPRLPSKWARDRVEEMRRLLPRDQTSDSVAIANLVDDAWAAGMEDAVQLADEGSGKETATLPGMRALTVAIRRIRAAAKEGKR